MPQIDWSRGPGDRRKLDNGNLIRIDKTPSGYVCTNIHAEAYLSFDGQTWYDDHGEVVDRPWVTSADLRAAFLRQHFDRTPNPEGGEG